jgi:hypothetical protein
MRPDAFWRSDSNMCLLAVSFSHHRNYVRIYYKKGVLCQVVIAVFPNTGICHPRPDVLPPLGRRYSLTAAGVIRWVQENYCVWAPKPGAEEAKCLGFSHSSGPTLAGCSGHGRCRSRLTASPGVDPGLNYKFPQFPDVLASLLAALLLLCCRRRCPVHPRTGHLWVGAEHSCRLWRWDRRSSAGMGRWLPRIAGFRSRRFGRASRYGDHALR